MNFNALIKGYFDAKEQRQRKIGRYNSSELWEILNNKIKPADFFKPKKFNFVSMCNIAEGELREIGLKMLFDASKIKYQYQVKDVWKEKEFEIVSVADFIFPDYVLECKSPNTFSGIKEYHRPQLEAQTRIFKKPVKVIYLKERFAYEAWNYVPSDKLWAEILIKVGEFSVALKNLVIRSSGKTKADVLSGGE